MKLVILAGLIISNFAFALDAKIDLEILFNDCKIVSPITGKVEVKVADVSSLKCSGKPDALSCGGERYELLAMMGNLFINSKSGNVKMIIDKDNNVQLGQVSLAVEQGIIITKTCSGKVKSKK